MSGGRSADMMDNADTPTLSASSIVHVLSNPQSYYFRPLSRLAPSPWYAINCEQSLVDSCPEATIAGRLGISQQVLMAALKGVGLGSSKEASWTKVLGSEIFIQKMWIGARYVNFIAFGKEPSFTARQQMEPGFQPQPTAASESNQRCGWAEAWA